MKRLMVLFFILMVSAAYAFTGTISCVNNVCNVAETLPDPTPTPTPGPTPTPTPTPTPVPINSGSCPQASSSLVNIPGGTPVSGGGLGMSMSTAEYIAAYGERHYFFCLSTPPTRSIQISMSTQDWTTNQDLLVSNESQPSCSQDPKKTLRNVTPNPPPWYNILAGSTESVLMYAPANQNLVYYVTVCSQSATGGKYGLYWSAN